MQACKTKKNIFTQCLMAYYIFSKFGLEHIKQHSMFFNIPYLLWNKKSYLSLLCRINIGKQTLFDVILFVVKSFLQIPFVNKGNFTKRS